MSEKLDCRACGEFKVPDEFARDRQNIGRGGRMFVCRACDNARRWERRKAAMVADKEYGEDGYAMTLHQVGQELGISRQAAHKAEQNALAKLRRILADAGFSASDFLECAP